jgi:TPR repeat protein
MGNAYAVQNVGSMDANGLFVKRDQVKALEWFERSGRSRKGRRSPGCSRSRIAFASMTSHDETESAALLSGRRLKE